MNDLQKKNLHLNFVQMGRRVAQAAYQAGCGHTLQSELSLFKVSNQLEEAIQTLRKIREDKEKDGNQS